MANKNLEKLAEIGEKKLLENLNNSLSYIFLEIEDIFVSLYSNAHIFNVSQTKSLNRKIKSYKDLITIFKNHGLKTHIKNIYAKELNNLINSYNNLIATCKNCGLDVTKQEEAYLKITGCIEKKVKNNYKQIGDHLHTERTEFLHKSPIKMQYREEIIN